MRTMEACQLKNYGFGSGFNDHALIIFGPGNIYNHRDPYTMGRFWAFDDEKDPMNRNVAHSDFKHILYDTRTSIAAGEEMYETYGNNWFKRFGSEESQSGREVEESLITAARISVDDLREHGHCLTDVRIRESTIPDAGQGLFANRDFLPGEVVTISPVLALPKNVVEDSVRDSVLKNYCFAEADSDLALFPINYGPLINHSPEPNVAIEWFDWSPAVNAMSAKYNGGQSLGHDLKLADKLGMGAQELYSASFAPLDIAYKATHSIKKGDEIFVSYGSAWQQAWDRYTARSRSTEQQKSGRPMFRQYMALPAGSYPRNWIRQPETSCGMFLVPSTIPGAGRGVVAGKDYVAHEFIEGAPTIAVTNYAADHSQLKNYVFGTNDSQFHVIIFGPGNIYNHRKPHTLGRSAPESSIVDPSFAPFPYATDTVVQYHALADIGTGDEMYETYGDHWFSRFAAEKTQGEAAGGDQEGDGSAESAKSVPARAVESRQIAQRMDVVDMEQHGLCLTDTAVQPSTLSNAGKGLFATRDFSPGEVVTISPVLALPKHVVDSTAQDTVLVNYCFAEADSDLALFPINYGPLINHSPEPNVAVEWFDWSSAIDAMSAKYNPGAGASQSLQLSEKLAMSVDELCSAHFAPLDIAYRASRAIKAGEEIFMHYGDAWQDAWEEYIRQVSNWKAKKHSEGVEARETDRTTEDDKPKFRHYISVPAGLFSSHWINSSSHDSSEL